MSDTKEAVKGFATEADHRTRFLLDGDILAARCAELGANNDRERARVMGVSRPTLHRWRNGSESVPRLDRIDEVCSRLNLSRDILFPGLR